MMVCACVFVNAVYNIFVTEAQEYVAEDEQFQNSINNVKAFFLDVQQKIKDSQFRLRQIQNEPYLRPYLNPFGDSTRFEIMTVNDSVIIATTVAARNVSEAAVRVPTLSQTTSPTMSVVSASLAPINNTINTTTTIKMGPQDSFIRNGPRSNIRLADVPYATYMSDVKRRGLSTVKPKSQKSHRARRHYLKKNNVVSSTAKVHHTPKPKQNVFTKFHSHTTVKKSTRHTNKKLRKITGDSSYSDEEMSLKVNLLDQLVHHNKVFNLKSIHKSVLEEPLLSDDEVVLRQNLYKAFNVRDNR